tara:strand:- start:3740 stop:4087 length:348 start_codon:yes stop_codon:yes gene_type:complete
MPAKKTSPSEPLIDELIKHNISLEKVSLELLESVNKMIKRTDRMLSLFEEAAKNIEQSEKLEEKPMAKQISDLVEQNRTIARGLILIERFVRDRTSAGFQSPGIEPKPLPKAELE